MTLDRHHAIRHLARLHEAQGALYAGGSGERLRELLTADIRWTVPGESPIAGSYEGIEQVMSYFANRRDIAAGTLKMHPRDILFGEGEHVAALTDGTAILNGAEERWSTVGLYRFGDGLIAACWLLPLDAKKFDRIWSNPARSRA